MTAKTSEELSSGMIDRPAPALSVDRVDPSELGTVASVLAEAFTEDPVLVWAMPKEATRLADATAFFTFYLRRLRSRSWEVFATPDRSAVAVMTSVGQVSEKQSEGSRDVPTLDRTSSSAADYFRWIESFRPDVPHRYLEFIGSSPGCRSKGQGSILLKSLLSMAAREGLPVWTWSSNPRNLPFYHRLDFVAGADLCWDADTPSVIPLLRPPVPLTTSQTAIDNK